MTMTFEARPQTPMARFLSRIMGLFVKGSMEKMIKQDLADIKAYVEATSTES